METHMENLLLVPVDDSVVFPNMTATLAIDVGDADRVVLVPRRGDEFADVGTIANVVNRVRLPGGGHAVELEGVERGRISPGSGRPSSEASSARRAPVPAATCGGRSSRTPTTSPSTVAPATSSASTA